jgi:cytochrome c oxidase cbb3-type subunit 3
MLRLFTHLGGKFSAVLCLFALPLVGAGATVQLAPKPAHAQESSDAKNPFEGDPAAIEEGRELFSRRCSFCHGTGGGGAKGPDLTSGKWKYGGRNTDLFATIAAGRPMTQMGSFATSMTTDEIWKVIAFIRSQYRGDAKKNPSAETPR